MDDFNNLNNSGGSFEGFDSAENKENSASVENTDSGYTVTPEGGFYTKQKEDIIQDEILKPENETASDKPEEKQEEPKSDFYPGGGYGKYTYDPTKPTMNSQKVKKSKASKKRYGGGVVALSAILAAVIGALSGIIAISLAKPNETIIKDNSGVSGSNININIDETVESVVEAVAKKVTPSVVGIRTTTSVLSFFGGQQEATGEGSGVIYSSDGYIITNYHVIKDAISSRTGSKIEVFVDSLDSESYIASVVGYNISSDLAVIKIDAKNLTAAEFTDSKELKVGQYVITIGNPGGLEFMDSVTYGVVSGLDRVVSESSSVQLIQTDAAINPGNSGGALVNTKGQLVGINSSKIVSEEFEGMGFAIPSNKVKEICDDIILKENTPEPYFGISISEKYTAEVLDFYGFPVGAVILSVADNSPASDAGLAKGDIITEFGGTAIKEYTMLEDLMKQCSPDEVVNVKIYRSGRYYTTKIKVGSNN